LTNLLENASKYSPSNGSLELLVKPTDEGMLRFVISDNGPGIPISQQATIFNKFTRANPVNGPKGIGLGLAFCRLVIEAHDGKIWLESSENAGSKFIFELPTETGRFL